jgi:hypothetical protein
MLSRLLHAPGMVVADTHDAASQAAEMGVTPPTTY